MTLYCSKFEFVSLSSVASNLVSSHLHYLTALLLDRFAILGRSSSLFYLSLRSPSIHSPVIICSIALFQLAIYLVNFTVRRAFKVVNCFVLFASILFLPFLSRYPPRYGLLGRRVVRNYSFGKHLRAHHTRFFTPLFMIYLSFLVVFL
ncbi:hypothetical protein C8Q75DRAFT_772386 [Abortiporus biennis]|nr:hypothetical protein C8Q75DRAFT_772386 [Abortiporus biennis]